MGALYDKIKTKSGSATTTGTSTGGSLYERIKNKQAGVGKTEFDTRPFEQRLNPPKPVPTAPRPESVSSYSKIAPKNFGLGEAPKAVFGIPSRTPSVSVGTTAQSTAQDTVANPISVTKGVLEGTKAVGRFAQEIPRGIAGTAAQGAAYAAGVPQENVSLDPTKMGPLGTALLGKDKIEPAKEGSALLALIPGVSDETAKKFGPGAYALLTISDFLTGPGKKKAAIETVKTLNDVKGARRFLKEAGIADDVITELKLDVKAVAAKTDAQAEAIFREAIEATGKKTPAPVTPVKTVSEAMPASVRQDVPTAPARVTDDVADPKNFKTADELGGQYSIVNTDISISVQKNGKYALTRNGKPLEGVSQKTQDLIHQKKVAADQARGTGAKNSSKAGAEVDDVIDQAIREADAGDLATIQPRGVGPELRGTASKEAQRIGDKLRESGELTDDIIFQIENNPSEFVRNYKPQPAQTLQLPALPKLPQETIRALEKPQVDNTINEAIMTRYKNAVSRPVKEDSKVMEFLKKYRRPSEIKKVVGDIMTPISSRLGRIAPDLEFKVIRKFERDTVRETRRRLEEVHPLFIASQKMSKEDRLLFDLARKNQDTEVIDALAKRYGIEEEVLRARDVLDDLHAEGNDVGMDIGYRKEYWPRIITDPQRYMQYLKQNPNWNVLNEVIQKTAEKKGLYVTDLSDEEQASIIESFLRGYGDKIQLSSPTFSKERTINILDEKLNEFYESSDDALASYITRMTDEIEGRRLFGKELGEEIGDKNMSQTIGAYVLKLLSDGKIKPGQDQQISDILQARFRRGKTNGAIQVYKNAEYLSLLANFVSTLSQVQDITYSLYNSGFYHTFKGVQKALSANKISKQDLGFDIAEEFSTTKKSYGELKEKGDFVGISGKAVEDAFRLVGFSQLDQFGKETLANGHISKLQSMSRDGDELLDFELEKLFDLDEIPDIKKALKSGEITEEVKFMAFNRVLDFQPVAKSEMPLIYLNHPNGRLFYALKTFTIKQIDIFRREAFDKITSGNPAEVKQGFKNLAKLSAIYLVVGASVDEVKDLLLGRETSLKDKMVDNIFKLFGATKYDVYKARSEGIGTTIKQKLLFPTSIYDRLSKDFDTIINDREYEKGPMKGENYKFESTQTIPVGGKLYYWWFGRGDQKEEYKEGGTSSTGGGLPSLPPLPKLPSLPSLPSL